MKRLRVPASGLHLGEYELDSEASRYAVKVHRVRVGDELSLFDPESGQEGQGRVLRARPESLFLDVTDVHDAASLALPVTLLQALGKGDKPEQAIRDATVLGARRVVLLQTDRTIVRSVGDDRVRRYRRVSVEAARQSGRSDLPEIVGPMPLAEAIEREGSTYKLVCAWHPRALPLLSALENWCSDESLALLIGPEGGLSEAELELALGFGFVPVSLGPLVLRTETAATVALGVLCARGAV